MFKLIVLPKVKEDILEVAKWYKTRQKGFAKGLPPKLENLLNIYTSIL
jgi:hypothetical protein